MTAVQSFIAGGTIEPEICDGVLEFYNTCDYLEKVPGETSQGVDKIIKQSKRIWFTNMKRKLSKWHFTFFSKYYLRCIGTI